MTTSQLGKSPYDCLGEPLPVDPQRSLRVRFGMLLGEDDFTTLSAYHRGKTWLHNAWLHRQGVVWGLRVGIESGKNEIQVLPGFALDGLGRELRLEVPMCVNVGAWLDAQERPPGTAGDDGRLELDLHVVIRFRTCLDRQVPSLSEPCEGSGATATHSRVIEQVEILLRSGLAPPRTTPPLPYHLLRLLFGLEPPRLDGGGDPVAADQEVLDARAALAALPAGERPPALLEAFRRCAARDVMELGPAHDEDGDATLMPAAEPGELVLAELRGLILAGSKGAWELESGEEVVSNEVRFSHVATATLEELLCGAACCVAGLGDGGSGAPGPRVSGEVVFVGDDLVFTVDAPLLEGSVASGATVTHFEPAAGWTELAVAGASLEGDRLTRVTLELAAPPPPGRVRLLLRGTGPTPILGADGTPLGARAGAASGELSGGNDFAFMIERT